MIFTSIEELEQIKAKCENCIQDLRKDKARFKALIADKATEIKTLKELMSARDTFGKEQARELIAKDKEIVALDKLRHCMENILDDFRAELNLKCEEIKALNELLASYDAILESGYYTGPGEYPPSPEEAKCFARREAARARLAKIREGKVTK